MPVNVIGTLKPKNNGKFPVAEAVDIKVTDNLRLDEALENKADLSTVNFALNQKAEKTTVDSLQGQINQIVISSSAESVVAPEVAAARVSEDGTEYSTLKERLDSKDASTADKIAQSDTKIDSTKDILDASFDKQYEDITYTTQSEKYIAPDGEVKSGTTYVVTNYIDISAYSMLEIKASVGYSNGYYAFYDSGYNFITGMFSDEGAAVDFEGDVSVPANAKYVVVSGTNDNKIGIRAITSYNAVSDDINKATSLVINNTSSDYEPISLTIVSNRLINTSGEVIEGGTENYTTATIDVTDMTKLQITASANYGNLLYVINDENGNILASEVSAAGNEVTVITNKTVDIPSGAKYCSAANIVNGARPTVAITNVIEGIIASDLSDEIYEEIEEMISQNIDNPEEVEQATSTVLNNLVYTDEPITLTIIPDKLINSSGVIVDYDYDTYTIATVDISNMIKIKVTASANFGNLLYVIKNDNGDILASQASAAGSTVTTITAEEIIVPVGAKYITAANIVGGQRPSIVIVNEVAGIKAADLTDEIWEQLRYLQPFRGKKWVCVGDSLTEVNSRTTKHYFDYVADATGITTVNFGVSGTGYKRHEEDDIAFYQRVQSIPTDADVVTIFGSGNDLTLIESLGTPSDTGTSTICGCINTTIDNIIERIPAVALGIVAPTPWQSTQPTLDGSGNMDRYTEALRQICMRRSIPFLDLFHCSNLRPWTQEGREACYSKDDGNGVHPDETGHKLIAPRFKSFVESLLI